MADEERWLRKNWATLVALVFIFGIALFLRAYFVYPLAWPDRLYSGGSDSFYYEAILRHGFETGEQLAFDPLLNYPLGLVNPRPPLFAWWSLLTGWLFSPAFGDPWASITFSFLLSTALFGALTVFPTYALVKEAFDRRAGLIAAFLLAVSPGHLQRSMASNADHDAMVLFFVVTGYYFFLRALESMNERRWVESWRKPAAIRAGVGAFFAENRASVLYSLFAALCVATVALIWQGWAYAPIILLVYFVFQLFFHRIRNVDPMGITILFGITMGVALLVAAPWYVTMGQVKTWFDVPAYLFGAAIVLGLVFTVTRDYPWALVVPTTLGAGSIALGVGILLNPALANAFVSGAGYFVQTKLYETIAEAQAPALSQIILSFGWGTYFLSLGALGYLLWQFASGRRTQSAYLFFVVWTTAAIIMAQAAARFIFNASPAFAATAGYAIALIVQRLDFEGLKRTYRSIAPGSRRAAIRKSVKVRHVVGSLILVFLLFLPNVWFAVDAAIPFESKYDYDRQIYDITPDFLRPPDYDSLTQGQNPFYLGAFGFSVPEDHEYFPAAWSWFREQDTDLPPSERPAFLSWWDYGFEAVDKGRHPTVADNFQNGYHLAGNVISAQSENEAIALLSLRLIEGDFHAHGRAFGPEVRAALVAFGIDEDSLEIAFRDPAGVIPTVKGDPERYGRYDDLLQPTNALYIYGGDLLTGKLDVDRQADLYSAIRAATGDSIRYFALDARLFPSSAASTGIFYAPIKLSDHRVVELRDGRILPLDFFRIWVRVRGNRIPIQDLGEFDRPDDPRGEIEYRDAFWNSFFYRAYVGFRPSDVGTTDDGIPGLTGQQAQNLVPLPTWNLKHWRLVYRTAYYNPFNDTTNHTQDWRAVNYDEAARLQQNITAGKINGAVDGRVAAAFTQGIVFVKYYDGAYVNGTVTVGGRYPVSGLHVTVTDELGVPHDEATTDAQGGYSVLAPFGQVTVTFSTGAVDPRTRIGSTPVQSVVLAVSDDASMRRDVDADGDGRADWLVRRDVVLPGSRLSGRAFLDLDGDGAYDDGTDRVLAGAGLALANRALGLSNTTTTGPDGRYEFRDVFRGATGFTITLGGREIALPDVDLSGTDSVRDMVVQGLSLEGRAQDTRGDGVPGAEVAILDRTNGTTVRVSADGTGRFAADALLVGEFEVVATSGDLASLRTLVSLSGPGTELNLTLRPSATVRGTTFVGGNVQAYTTVEFTYLPDRGVKVLAISDATGTYSATLPAGTWSVTGRHYVAGRLHATLGTLAVARGTAVDYSPSFLDAVEVRGVMYGGSVGNVTRAAGIAFRSLTGSLYLTRTSNFGVYLAYLPKGTYDIVAFQEGNAFQDRRTFTGDTTLDFPATFRPQARVTVYRDLDGDGLRDVEEGLPGILVELTDSRGRVIPVFSGPDGMFTVPLDAAETYGIGIQASGFAPYSRGPEPAGNVSGIGSIPLVANPVRVTGTLRSAGSPVTGTSIEVFFLATGDGGVTAGDRVDPTGAFSADLAPGDYLLIVDENVTATSDAVRWQNSEEDALTLDVGQGSLVRDLDVVQRARVTGTVTFQGAPVDTTVTFEGPDDRAVATTGGGFSVYLAMGAYAAYANRTVSGVVYLFAGSVDVSGPLDVPMALERATEVSGRVTLDGTPVTTPLTITFTRAQSGVFRALSGPTGSYLVSLPAGDHTASVDERTTSVFAGVERFVRLSFTGTLSLATGEPSATLDAPLTRSLDNSTVTGRSTVDGAGAPAVIRFTQRSAAALNATVTSAGNGSYSVGLQPGTYNVHAVATGSARAFLGTFSVSVGADGTLPLTLVPASHVTGVTTYRSGVRVPADLTFTGAATASAKSDAAGAYDVVLPPGTYTATARVTEIENGVPVVYSRSANLVVSGAVDPLNLALERVARRAIVLDWDPAERTAISGGGSVTYTIEITNAGNTDDEYALSGTPATWTFTFDRPRVSLGFGTAGNTTSVDVTIRTPADALVDHGDVTISARSTRDSAAVGSLTVQVDILRRRAVSLSVTSVVPTFDGRFLNYTVTVTNSGNARETLGLIVPNLGELQSRGWIARFAPPAGGDRLPELRNLSVDGNTSRSVTLVFESRGGATGTTAIVRTFSEDLTPLEATVQFRLDLPTLAGSGRIGATGTGITIEMELPYPLLAVLVTIVVCVSAGLVLTMRRRR